MTDYVDWENLHLLFEIERNLKIYQEEQEDYIHVEFNSMLTITPDDDIDIF